MVLILEGRFLYSGAPPIYYSMLHFIIQFHKWNEFCPMEPCSSFVPQWTMGNVRVAAACSADLAHANSVAVAQETKGNSFRKRGATVLCQNDQNLITLGFRLKAAVVRLG